MKPIEELEHQEWYLKNRLKHFEDQARDILKQGLDPRFVQGKIAKIKLEIEKVEADIETEINGGGPSAA